MQEQPKPSEEGNFAFEQNQDQKPKKQKLPDEFWEKQKESLFEREVKTKERNAKNFATLVNLILFFVLAYIILLFIEVMTIAL